MSSTAIDASGSRPRPSWSAASRPSAPINRLAMLHGYISPASATSPARPGSDLRLRHSRSRARAGGGAGSRFRPALFRLPGDRSQDRRLQPIGAMYGTKPGFYLLVGPAGTSTGAGRHRRRVPQPRPISAPSFRACSRHDDKADNAALQPLLQQIMAYPLSEFDGTIKNKDWTELPSFPGSSSATRNGNGSTLPPSSTCCRRRSMRRGRSPARRRSTRWCARCSTRQRADRSLRKALKDAAAEADEILVKPLLAVPQFRHSAAAQLDHGDQQRRVRHRLSTPAPQSPSRTSSSTGRARRAISIRTSINAARGSPAPPATP